MKNYDEGIEAPVSNDAFELDASPVLQQFQSEGEQQYWIAELEAAQKERLKFDERGRKTIKRYADERDGAEQGKSYFNVFFANTEMKMAALYARTPQPDIKRRFDDPDDDVSRVAANLLQRNISYELECGDFDARVKQMLFDRVVPGLGVGWVRFEQEDGPATFDAATGLEVPSIVSQESQIDYVAWDDFYWSPCRVWTECRWVARKVPMSKDAIKTRFGQTAPAEVLANLPYHVTVLNKVASKDALKPKNLTQATVDVYEFWDKERRLVFWISPSADVPLDVQADTNEFSEFFPTPLPPLGRFTTSSTLPISDYSLVQNQYIELDDLNNRSTNLIKALQLKWAFDSANDELKDLYQTGAELQGIPVKNWPALQEKGGLRGAVEFAPLDEVANTYNKLIQAREAVKAQIYEIEGISDLMRGAPTPYESASATNMKGKLSSSRMAVTQREVSSYIEGLLRLKAHLICKFFSPQVILQRAGQLPQADMQYVGQALQLLKSVPFSHFRLLVSVDSIQLPNWNDEKQERNELIHAVTAFMGQLLPAARQTPEVVPLGLSLLKFAVAGYKGAKDIEGVLDQQLQQLAMSASQPQQQPPKPTDGELKAQTQQMRVQADMQIAQLEEQTKLQLGQLQAQMKQMELQLKAYDAQTRARAVDATIQDNHARQRIDTVRAAHDNAVEVISFPAGGF